MNDLKMFTQSEVAKLLNCNKDNITMLREVGVLKAIKTGRNYMYPKQELERFINEYVGLDVSNRANAASSLAYVENKKHLEEIKKSL